MLTLREVAITTPEGTTDLEGTRATVDSSGSVDVTQRATFTRMGLGALVAGPVGAVAAGVAGKKKRKHDLSAEIRASSVPYRALKRS